MCTINFCLHFNGEFFCSLPPTQNHLVNPDNWPYMTFLLYFPSMATFPAGPSSPSTWIGMTVSSMFYSFRPASSLCHLAHSWHIRLPKTSLSPCHFSIPKPLVSIFAHPLAENSGTSSVSLPVWFYFWVCSRNTPVQAQKLNKILNFYASVQAPFLNWKPLIGVEYDIIPTDGNLAMPVQSANAFTLWTGNLTYRNYSVDIPTHA